MDLFQRYFPKYQWPRRHAKDTPGMNGDICTNVVCTFDTFENYLGITLKFTKYLKKSCCFSSDQHFLFNFIFKKCFGHLDITKIVWSILGTTGLNRLNREGALLVHQAKKKNIVCFL